MICTEIWISVGKWQRFHRLVQWSYILCSKWHYASFWQKKVSKNDQPVGKISNNTMGDIVINSTTIINLECYNMCGGTSRYCSQVICITETINAYWSNMATKSKYTWASIEIIALQQTALHPCCSPFLFVFLIETISITIFLKLFALVIIRFLIYS